MEPEAAWIWELNLKFFEKSSFFVAKKIFLQKERASCQIGKSSNLLYEAIILNFNQLIIEFLNY